MPVIQDRVTMSKTTVVVGLLFLIMCSYGLAADKNTPDSDSSALKIIERVDEIMGLDDIRSTQKMTVHRKDGSVRVYLMNVMTSGRDKAFAEIIEPPREKGRQMLKLGEVVWSYLPSVKKSIRVSGRSKFMGGDFENNDILRLNLVEDYVPEIVEESPDQYVLELIGKNLGLSYAKIRVWVNKKNFQPVRQEYYTINDKLIKTSAYRDVRDFGGLNRPAVVEMFSALSPKKKTVLELIEFRKGVKNPDKIFRRSNLGK